jgi:hypothetical protein
MKTFIKTKIILIVCLYAIDFYGQRVTPEMDKAIHSLTLIKEDKRFVWAKSDLGVVRINKHTYKTWLVSPKVIALPSPIVTGLVNDGNVTYVSTNKGIVYDDGSCTLNMTTDNTTLPENNIVGMKWGCGGLLIRTKHYGWYLATGNPIKTYRIKRWMPK